MTDGSTFKHPFEVLQDFERRSLAHEAGLPEQAQAQGIWSGIAFRIHEHVVACRIDEVVEITTMQGSLTRVPGAQDWLLGVSNVRGNLVPVADLNLFLGNGRTATSKQSRVLIIDQEGGQVGLLIDEVLGQRHLEDTQAVDSDAFDSAAIGRYVERAYQRDDQLIGVFDMSSLTNDSAFTQAAA